MSSAKRMKTIIFIIILNQILGIQTTFRLKLHFKNYANSWNHKKIVQPSIGYFCSNDKIVKKSSFQPYIPKPPTILYKNHNVKKSNVYYITQENFKDGNRYLYNPVNFYNTIEQPIRKSPPPINVMMERRLSARSIIFSPTRRIKCRRGQIFLYGRCRRRRFFG